MTFKEKVAFYQRYYVSADEEVVDEDKIEAVREMIEERYEVVAHRVPPPSREKTFAHLVALQLILNERAAAAHAHSTDPEASLMTGEVKAIQVGDARTEFSTGNGAAGSYGAIDQNGRLQDEYDRLWKSLIANTRRLWR